MDDRHSKMIARWNRLPKVRREQALYDMRFSLRVLRDAAKRPGHHRDRAHVALWDLMFAAAGFDTEQDAAKVSAREAQKESE